MDCCIVNLNELDYTVYFDDNDDINTRDAE